MKALTGPGFQSFSGILPFSWDKNIAPPHLGQKEDGQLGKIMAPSERFLSARGKI